jgi:DUF1680 family protein
MVAILYGPIVLAGELGTKYLPKASWFLRSQNDTNKITDPDVPALTGSARDVVNKIIPVEGKSLVFRTKNLAKPEDIVLIPFYRMHHQRYSVYWKVSGEDLLNKQPQAQLSTTGAMR